MPHTYFIPRCISQWITSKMRTAFSKAFRQLSVGLSWVNVQFLCVDPLLPGLRHLFLEKWALGSVAKACLSGGSCGSTFLWQSAEYYKCLERGALGWNTYVSPFKHVLSYLLWLGLFWGVWGNPGHEGTSHPHRTLFYIPSKTILWDYWKVEESIDDPTTLAYYHHFWCIAFHYYKCVVNLLIFYISEKYSEHILFGHSFYVFGINKL